MVRCAELTGFDSNPVYIVPHPIKQAADVGVFGKPDDARHIFQEHDGRLSFPDQSKHVIDQARPIIVDTLTLA
jgi:hypothetical protein